MINTIPETWGVSKILEILWQAQPALRRKSGVSEIGVSGSHARNEQVEGSDVDILVGLRDKLEHLPGLKVDLVLKGGIHRRQESGLVCRLCQCVKSPFFLDDMGH